jgi:hypothetical protein
MAPAVIWRAGIPHRSFVSMTTMGMRLPGSGGEGESHGSEVSEREKRETIEALKKKGMSESRAARIANSPKASSHGGKKIWVRE